MTGGFAFVAYPAEYAASGVMTFVMGPTGTIFEKNLDKGHRNDCQSHDCVRSPASLDRGTTTFRKTFYVQCRPNVR